MACAVYVVCLIWLLFWFGFGFVTCQTTAGNGKKDEIQTRRAVRVVVSCANSEVQVGSSRFVTVLVVLCVEWYNAPSETHAVEAAMTKGVAFVTVMMLGSVA